MINNLKNMKNYVEVPTKYGTVLISNKDMYIYYSLISTKIWEEHIGKVFEKFVKNGDTVIDAGSFVGTHTLHLSNLVGNKGSVLAFEPNKYTYTGLVYGLIKSKCYNVSTYNYGLGKEKDVMYINDVDVDKIQNCGCVILETQNKNSEVEHKVNVDSLDNLLLDKLESLRLIKIDCEYMEYDVLEGAKHLLEKFKPILVIEIHSEEVKKVCTWLIEHNYNTVIQIENSWDYLCIHD